MRMFRCQVAVPGDPHVESATWKIWKARWSWNFHGMSYGITMLKEDQPNNFFPACELVRYIAWCTKYHVNKCEYGSILGYQLNHSIYHLYYLNLYLSNQWVYQTLILILPHSSNHIKQSNLGPMNSVPCTSMGGPHQIHEPLHFEQTQQSDPGALSCRWVHRLFHQGMAIEHHWANENWGPGYRSIGYPWLWRKILHVVRWFAIFAQLYTKKIQEIHPVDGWAHQLRWSLKLGYRKWLRHFMGNRTQFLIEVDLLVIFPSVELLLTPVNPRSNWASEHAQHTDAAQGICHIFHLSCWQAGLNPGEDQMDRIWYETYICNMYIYIYTLYNPFMMKGISKNEGFHHQQSENA